MLTKESDLIGMLRFCMKKEKKQKHIRLESRSTVVKEHTDRGSDKYVG
jgi:hypothetical protein